jgi:hypothetical protein
MFFPAGAHIIIEPFTVEQAHLARQDFLDFGKGRQAAEFRRLLRLCARQHHRRASPLQGGRFQKDRHPICSLTRSRMTNSSAERTLFSDGGVVFRELQELFQKTAGLFGRFGLLA